ncbi:MAG: hypothetical protein ACREVW_01010 [Burkholderiales bacterium]
MPYFTANMTVRIYLRDSSSMHPDASVRVNCLIWSRDDEFRGAKEAAQTMLRRFGVDQKTLDAAEYEHQVDGYIACDSRGVRNPDREPIEAFAFPEKKGEARLIKQRRLVPESHREMVEFYGPKPAEAAVQQGTAAA